jgi:hypothetical protein
MAKLATLLDTSYKTFHQSVNDKTECKKLWFHLVSQEVDTKVN